MTRAIIPIRSDGALTQYGYRTAAATLSRRRALATLTRRTRPLNSMRYRRDMQYIKAK